MPEYEGQNIGLPNPVAITANFLLKPEAGFLSCCGISATPPRIARTRALMTDGGPRAASTCASLRRYSALFVAIIVMLVAPLSSHADDLSPQVWISPGIYSWHFDRGKDLRDDNPGVGLEAALRQEHVLLAGTFINSRRTRSRYAGYLWRPLHWSTGEWTLGAGISIVAFDGYSNYRDGGWFLAPLPVLSVEWKYLGANLGVVPTLKDRVDGALSVQFKLRVW